MLDDMLERLKAYESTGVDALFLSGLKTKVQLETIARHVSLPIMLGTLGSEYGSVSDIAKFRVRIVHSGQKPYMASIAATYEMLETLRADPFSETAGSSKELLEQLSHKHEYLGAMQRYLGRRG